MCTTLLGSMQATHEPAKAGKRGRNTRALVQAMDTKTWKKMGHCSKILYGSTILVRGVWEHPYGNGAAMQCPTHYQDKSSSSRFQLRKGLRSPECKQPSQS